MTRIDFYLDAEDRLQVACRLATKAVWQGHSVIVYAPDEGVARALDRALWTTPPTGFLPHVMATHRLAAETPVVIAGDGDELPHDDVLVNLHHAQPPGFGRFRRLVEIVGRDEADKQAARERFRHYRDRGYELHTHRLGAAPRSRDG
jgi:DNA polymerase-3 subunit chi